MFWGLLFGVVFFIPVFGMLVGAGLGAIMGTVAKTGIDRRFQEQPHVHAADHRDAPNAKRPRPAGARLAEAAEKITE